MEKLKFNPSNKKYYSEEFIKGFECGVERQFNADIEEKTAEWIDLGFKEELYGEFGKCSNCGVETLLGSNYCPNCGAKMEESGGNQ